MDVSCGCTLIFSGINDVTRLPKGFDEAPFLPLNLQCKCWPG